MSNFKIPDYELETIREIRKLNSRLNKLTRNELRTLYREWSDKIASAHWLAHNNHSIKYFVQWATTAPCDRL